MANPPKTETVTVTNKLTSVVLIPSSGALIFNSSNVIEFESGEEVLEGSETQTTTVTEVSEVYRSIMAARPVEEVVE